MQLLLPIHIIAAGLGLVSGAAALFAAKGARLHRASGRVFVYSMVAMCGTATTMAVVNGQAVNVIAGTLTAYLAVTALTTVRPPSARSGRVNVGLMAVALVLALATFTAGFEALASVSGKKYGYPSFPFFMFGTIGLLGGVGDFRMIRAGGLRGAPRLSRHLWRMCTALWIAAASFFSIRARVAAVLPAPFASPAMRALPVLLILVAMVYWLWRVRVRHTYPRTRPRRSSAGAGHTMPAASSAPTY